MSVAGTLRRRCHLRGARVGRHRTGLPRAEGRVAGWRGSNGQGGRAHRVRRRVPQRRRLTAAPSGARGRRQRPVGRCSLRPGDGCRPRARTRRPITRDGSRPSRDGARRCPLRPRGGHHEHRVPRSRSPHRSTPGQGRSASSSLTRQAGVAEAGGGDDRRWPCSAVLRHTSAMKVLERVRRRLRRSHEPSRHSHARAVVEHQQLDQATAWQRKGGPVDPGFSA